MRARVPYAFQHVPIFDSGEGEGTNNKRRYSFGRARRVVTIGNGPTFSYIGLLSQLSGDYLKV